MLGLPVSGRAMGMARLVASELATNARQYTRALPTDAGGQRRRPSR
ncbi:hypothetical protein [Streptomyces sp. NPDC004546]